MVEVEGAGPSFGVRGVGRPADRLKRIKLIEKEPYINFVDVPFWDLVDASDHLFEINPCQDQIADYHLP